MRPGSLCKLKRAMDWVEMPFKLLRR